MPGKERVSLIDCEDYDPERVYAAVRQALAPLGGIETYVKPGQRVLLQVNLISARPPEDAVCTHPRVVRAVCRLVREAGGIPAVGGSTGGCFTFQRTDRSFRVSGITAAAEAEGARVVNYDEVGGTDVATNGKFMSTVHIAKPVLETDVLITLPKMKTHTLTLLTGAVKNHMGTLPGMRKMELHRRFSDPSLFGEAMLDVYAAAPPRLAVMDAVQGMDGEGPTQGHARQVGLIAASADGVALDAVMCDICGLDPKWVPTLVAARERGFGTAALDGIEVVGTALATARGRTRPFSYPQTYRIVTLPWLPQPVVGLVKKLSSSPLPYVITEKCNGCGTCAKNCPAQAATVVEKKARIQTDSCIACFCCQEMCEQGAIGIKMPLMFRRMNSAEEKIQAREGL